MVNWLGLRFTKLSAVSVAHDAPTRLATFKSAFRQLTAMPGGALRLP